MFEIGLLNAYDQPIKINYDRIGYNFVLRINAKILEIHYIGGTSGKTYLNSKIEFVNTMIIDTIYATSVKLTISLSAEYCAGLSSRKT